jgi:hypothetical protein
VKKSSAIENLGDAISRALDEAPVSDVLSVLTGAFVALTVELIRRKGLDVNQKIEVDGGHERDITIHAPKGKSKGTPPLTQHEGGGSTPQPGRPKKNATGEGVVD